MKDSEENNSRLQGQLTETNNTAENLIKSLGKKEGELAGFQEQLSRAMEALNKSEEAVEALQAQLRAERADFELKLKEQALSIQVANSKELEGLRQQIADLQRSMAVSFFFSNLY